MQKEPSFAVGDTVEVLTGDYPVMCGTRVYDWETSGTYEVTSVEYELGQHTYQLVDDTDHTVRDVNEQDLRRVS